MGKLTTKIVGKSGDIHKISVQFEDSMITIVRVILTKNKELADSVKYKRKFKDKYYVDMWVMLTYKEMYALIKGVLLNPIKVIRLIKEGKRQ